MNKQTFYYLLGFMFSFTMLMTSCAEEENSCEGVICQNDGTCIDGTCDCPDGFSGPNCEVEDPCHEAIINNEWGYDDFGGPACWNEVCGNDGCSGGNQSPVNITNATTTTDLPAIEFSSIATKTEILNNGNTIEFLPEPGSFTTYGKLSSSIFNDFTIGQFHFHVHSEHQLEGQYAPLEAHFVCRSIWADRYIVVTLLFEEGASNDFLAKFVDNLPAEAEDTYSDPELTYDPFEMIPADRSHYNYSGSLTTPPCSEVVTWIVMETKVEASAEQIEAFRTILGDNFRPLQELNGRTIQYVED